MVIIGGSARGVRLLTLPGNQTRPILDRVKKSLFSMLESSGLVAGARVLDLYAGAGTLGLEALSRGAAHVLFVERSAAAVELLRQNLSRTRLTERAEVCCGEAAVKLELLNLARREARGCTPFRLIFHDPPFAFSREAASRAALEAELVAAGRLLEDAGRLILRCERKTSPPRADGLELVRHWQDGPHALCFYAAATLPAGRS